MQLILKLSFFSFKTFDCVFAADPFGPVISLRGGLFGPNNKADDEVIYVQLQSDVLFEYFSPTYPEGRERAREGGGGSISA